MEKMNKNRIILLVVFSLLVLFSFYIYNKFNKKEVDNKNETEQQYILLDDYSRFFTVNSCVYKYINYLQSKNSSNLLKVLDKNFIQLNNINENNLYDYLENINGNYSFVSKEIYYEKINDKYIKYYVYGYLIEDKIDEKGKKFDRYYVVTFDLENYLFSIIPYNGDIFKEVENG